MSENETEYVLVTEYFHPDTASTGQLMTDLAVGLQERGLDMTVYTGQPNYHSGVNKKQPSTSTYEGVQVNRIRAPQVRQSSFLRRAFNWVVFTVWMFFQLLVLRPKQNQELVFVSNPPFLPIAMWFVCKLRGWEYTYIVYDLYPDFTIETGYFKEGGLVDTVWSTLNENIFGDAKHIVSLGPVMRDRIISNARDDFDATKVAIIHNWEDEEFIEPKEKDENWFAQEHDIVGTFTLLYSGNIGGNHDLETVVEAAANLDDTDDVTLLIIGEGDKKAEIVELAEQHNLRGGRVKFLPYQPLEDLPYSLTAGDVSIVTVQEGMEGVCVSSKLYTAMAAGMPILVIAQPNDDEARIVESCAAGIQVSQGDVDAGVEAIRTWSTKSDIVEEQGQNAREAFESQFTKSHSIDRYYRLLDDDHTLEPDSLAQHSVTNESFLTTD
ncbi:glycosyltransferase family 4 protein [Haladaptatus sp. DYSN1]|uniref:glycosyltransferase family 4 protein n=1 Tax=unclassified Haladaptatus TaxID=2622732 RepID=UPI00240530C6|nr:glycosyltransferase family 4 protein [Haladaptatus sp. DYSN1]